MQRNVGLPTNWMSMPPIVSTVEGMLNSMLTNFRSSLKKTVSIVLHILRFSSDLLSA